MYTSPEQDYAIYSLPNETGHWVCMHRLNELQNVDKITDGRTAPYDWISTVKYFTGFEFVIVHLNYMWLEISVTKIEMQY